MPTASFSQIKELQTRVGKEFDLKACKEALNQNDCDVARAAEALQGGVGASPEETPPATPAASVAPAAQPSEWLDVSVTEAPAIDPVPTTEWFDFPVTENVDTAPATVMAAAADVPTAELFDFSTPASEPVIDNTGPPFVPTAALFDFSTTEDAGAMAGFG